MSWRLELTEGADALERLRRPDFLRRWRELARRDPKSTWFQEPPFVLSWYEAYRKRWRPLVLRGVADDGGWLGLLALATDGEHIAHAGTNHAWYHGWIADPTVEGEFPAAAAERALERHAGRSWTWKFIPADAPAGWAERVSGGGVVTEHPSPVWRLTDDDAIDRHLESKSLRNYINRYRREGELRLVRVFGRADTRRALRTLAPWCDLRHGAVHADLPFRDDPHKLPFHEALAVADGSVQTSALRLDDRPLAIHLGAFDGRRLFLGLHGYDPTEGKRSPGTILLIELARQVAESGGIEIDLTPGGEGWKERWATDHRVVHRLELFSARRHRRMRAWKLSLREGVKGAMRRVGADPEVVRRHLRVVEERPETTSPTWYEVDVEIHGASGRPGREHFDAVDAPWLEELLSFADDHGRDATADFLGDGLRHLDKGWRPVCMTAESGLVRVAWLQPPDTAGLVPDEPGVEGRLFRADVPEGLAGLRVPGDGAMLMLGHEGADATAEGFLSLLTEAARRAGRRRLWVRVPADHVAARRWLESQARPLEEAMIAGTEERAAS